MGEVAAGLSLPLLNADPPLASRGDMPYRPLGRTGERVSLLGLGGWHLGRMASDAECTRFVHAAIESGINFMDNCWDYNNGVSEYRLGKALTGGYRQKVFLMTKIDGQTRDASAWQLDECLLRLRTDVIDLLQFHEVVRMDDPDRIFGPRGAIETLIAAKEAGKIRFIGFTGHFDPDVFLKMLDVSSRNKFTFDAAQMPLNVMDAHYRSFTQKVLPVLVQQGIGVLGMKTLGGGSFLGKGAFGGGRADILSKLKITPAECLQYAMSLPASVVISGMDDLEMLKTNVEIACRFRQMTESEIAALLAKTREVASTGQYEWFKSYPGGGWTGENPWVLG
jgi:predicted aldo/keto reductase-like oxidoreductase